VSATGSRNLHPVFPSRPCPFMPVFEQIVVSHQRLDPCPCRGEFLARIEQVRPYALFPNAAMGERIESAIPLPLIDIDGRPAMVPIRMSSKWMRHVSRCGLSERRRARAGMPNDSADSVQTEAAGDWALNAASAQGTI
jgi:hypothetical protein